MNGASQIRSTVLSELFQRPAAPEHSFDSFVVGHALNTARRGILDKIDQLANGTAPSQILVVTAENGNGKTLLQNMLKEELGRRNEIRDHSDAVGCRFDYFFSHVKTDGIKSEEIGYHLLQALQFHPKWPSTYTYSLISLRLFQQFLQTSYQLPWYVRLALPIKWIMKGGLNTLDKGLGGMLSDILGEAAGEAFEAVNKRAQLYLSNQHIQMQFRNYCDNTRIGSILVDHYSRMKKYLPPDKFNKSIFDALNSAHMLDSAADAITAMRDLISTVGAKVLVVMVDDANDDALLKNFVGLINRLDALDRDGTAPKVLLMLSMLSSRYDDVMRSTDDDKSLRQRLGYNGRVVLPSPTAEDIASLIARLEYLSSKDAPVTSASASLSAPDKASIVEECKNRPYRYAMRCIGRHLRPDWQIGDGQLDNDY
jgi:hypothetical protein